MDNDGDLRLLPHDCWTRVTLSSQGEHQDHEAGHSYHTFGIPFPDALDIRVCSALLETTSGEKGVRFHRSCRWRRKRRSSLH